VLRALVASGFKGDTYPINPNVSELEGLRCYPTIGDAPHGIDLAVIAVPKAAVLAVVDQCAAAGVKSVVGITAGSAEAGDEGGPLGGGRGRGGGAAGGARRQGACARDPDGRTQLHGPAQRRSGADAERVVLAGDAAERSRGAVVAERRARAGDHRARPRARR